MKLSVYLWFGFGIAILNSRPSYGYGINGGIECAACTIATGIFVQVGQINKGDLVNITLNLCDHLFAASKICRNAVQVLDPILTLLIETRTITPDTFCYGLNFCHQDPGEKACHLFPPPSHSKFSSDIKYIRERARPFIRKWYGSDPDPSRAYSLCSLPGVKELCVYINRKFNGMEPIFDPDGDKFSSLESWRGSRWRGRDCADLNANIYPGRQPHNADITSDTNCNGIWGVDEKTGIPWETKFCRDTKTRGIAMLGDSVGAHFHFPLAWFSPKMISSATFFKNATGPVLDELDWPQYSFSTGFKNISEPDLINGTVDSLYLRMRRWNLCNHRDYQNICRNGATSFNLVENVKNIARRREDKPITVLIGVLGNDVCNRFPDTLANMTTSKQFYNNIKEVIKTLDLRLPPKSHLVLLGLVNGSFIFDTLANRFHPIGELNKDVRYKDVFKWFECMQISPCNGWFSENQYIRDETTKRSFELSRMMKYLASTYISKNISLSYMPNPLHETLQRWKKNGGEVWQLFEPVDGFHPNQIAQAIITDILWKNLKSIAPESIGTINKFNNEIIKRFGDQGGH